MAGYTKGEWRRGSMEDKPFARSILSIYREDGRRIAEATREGFMAFEEAEANANLISASPELYEASKEVMALLKQYGGAIVPHLLDTDDNPGEFLRQALAKAGGK